MMALLSKSNLQSLVCVLHNAGEPDQLPARSTTVQRWTSRGYRMDIAITGCFTRLLHEVASLDITRGGLHEVASRGVVRMDIAVQQTFCAKMCKSQ